MQAASLDPETFTEGGLFEGNGVVRDPRFVRWDYGGRRDQQNQPITSLAIRAVLVDADGVGHEQFWSAGGLEDFAPSPDGAMAIPQSGKTGLNRHTNAALLLTEIINCGFPKNRLTSAVTCLDGLYATWVRRKAPERPGLNQQPRAAGAREPQVLVPVQILNLPWEPSKHPNGGQVVKMAETRQTTGQPQVQVQGQVTIPQGMPPFSAVLNAVPQGVVPAQVPQSATTGQPPTPAAAAPAAPAAPAIGPDGDLDNAIKSYLIVALSTGSKTKVELAQQVFQPTGGVNQHPRRNEISSWVFNDGYLGRLAGEKFLAYDGQRVSRP